ncbi:hypothetical protein ABVT39_024899 [Epinephelus coioides]
MDPKLVKEIMDYKIHNSFPGGLTKHQRYTIKRRASTFVLKVNAGKRGRPSAEGEPANKRIKKANKGEINYLPNLPDGFDQAALEGARKDLVDEMQMRTPNGPLVKKKMDQFALRREENLTEIETTQQTLQFGNDYLFTGAKNTAADGYRRASTIKNIVMYKNMTPNKTTWLTTTGMYRCGNCACCNNTTNTKSFNHPHTGKKIPIQEFINCKSTHVVYMLSCPCGLVYVGQTKRPLKQRISEHKTAIRTGNMDYAIAKHYAEANHGSPSSLRFCGIEKITIPTRGGDVLKKLAQREMFWIYILNTMAPNGLNDDFSLKCFLG